MINQIVLSVAFEGFEPKFKPKNFVAFCATTRTPLGELETLSQTPLLKLAIFCLK